MVRLLYQLFCDVIYQIIIDVPQILVRLCHCWVLTSQVAPSANFAADSFYLFGFNIWQGRMKIHIEMMRYICVYIINHLINDSCIVLIMCCTSCTNLWRDTKFECIQDWQAMVDGPNGGGNECWVNFINQWSLIHPHLLYAIDLCPVYNIFNFNCCKSKLVLIKWLSRLWLNKQWTFNWPHECIWGI